MKTPPVPNSYIRELLAQIESLTAEKEAAEREVDRLKAPRYDPLRGRHSHDKYWYDSWNHLVTHDGTVGTSDKPAIHYAVGLLNQLEFSLAQAREEIATERGNRDYWHELWQKEARWREAAEQREKWLVEALDIPKLVDRFLSWPIPESVCSDPCVVMHGYRGRVGTNLLTADESRQMLEHVLETALAAAPKPTQELAKFQPCGYVVRTCEENEENRCMGCGAKNCGAHPVGEFPNPLYVAAASKEGD